MQLEKYDAILLIGLGLVVGGAILFLMGREPFFTVLGMGIGMGLLPFWGHMHLNRKGNKP